MQQQITETLISFKVAKLAKEKGFSLSTPRAYINGNLFTNFEESFGESDFYFDADDFHKNWNDKGWVFDVKGNSCFGCSLDNKKYFAAFAAPTQDLLRKWLLGIHNIHITIFSKSQEFWMHRVTTKGQSLEEGLYDEDFYSHDEAREEALFQALNLLPDVNI